MKRDRRQCQGIMVCSEAFKNGDDVTQLEMICISETYTPFPRTFGKSATSNGSFFFKSTDTTSALDPLSRFMLWGSGSCMQG